MQMTFSKALSKAASDHIELSDSRMTTLSWLALCFLRVGTVCVGRLAAYVESEALETSVLRRFERFFQHVRLGLDGAVARIVVQLLRLDRQSWELSLDRTNWEFGKTSINILMLCVHWNGVGVPLMWTLLEKKGNSNSAERIALMQRLRKTFPGQRIDRLLADREFIGKEWIDWLTNASIPFVLRVKENMRVFNDSHASVPLSRLASGLRIGERLSLKGTWRLGQSENDASLPVRIGITRLKSKELLIVATSLASPKRALELYRHRWKIESLFAALKTRGFNLESTNMTDPAKLSTLLSVLALASVIAVKSGAIAAAERPVRRKSHGRPARSLAAYGRAFFNKIFAGNPGDQVKLLLHAVLLSKRPWHGLAWAM
jgi:hypothetical protein